MAVAQYVRVAHGVTIHSSIPLAPLGAASSATHRVGATAVTGETAADHVHVHHAVSASAVEPPDAGVISLRAEDGVIYQMRDGREITVYTDDPESPSITRFITGPALATILFQRGFAVLHASAVRCGDVVIAFAGASGVGKSTLAAEFIRRGWDLVADDFISLSGTRLVHSDDPLIRLWPDAAAVLARDRLRPIAVQPDVKPEYAVVQKFREPLPPVTPTIFMLSRGPAPRVEKLTANLALYQLLGNSFCAPYFDQANLADDFPRWSALALEADCWELCSKDALDRVGEAADLVEGAIAT